jgi:O-antigen/teichoic acid export membrane protein
MPSSVITSSIKKNYVYNTLLNLSNILFPLVTFAYVARVLGPEMFGKVAFATSFVGYFLLLACLGIPIYGNREIARARSGGKKAVSGIFSELFLLNACSTVAACLLFLIPLFWVDRLRAEPVLFLVTGCAILINVFSVDWLFQGMEKYGNVALRSFLFKLLGLVFLFLSVRAKSDYLWYATVGVVVTGGANISGFIMSRKLADLTFSKVNLRVHLRPTFLLLGASLTVCIYIYLDSVVLGFLAGNTAVGLYTAASKVVRTAVVLVTSLSVVLIPRVSFYLKNNLLEEHKNITQKSVQFILLVATPLSVALFCLAPCIVSLIAGAQFAGAATAIRIDSPLIVVLGLSNFYSLQILYPNGKETRILFSALCAAGVDVLLNFALIPILSFNGTAIASLAAELTALVTMMIMSRNLYSKMSLNIRRAGTYLAASAVMGAVIYCTCLLIHQPLMQALASFAIGTTFYVGALFLVKDPLVCEIVGIALAKIPISNRSPSSKPPQSVRKKNPA